MQSKGLSRVFSNTTVQKHQFFGAQPAISHTVIREETKKQPEKLLAYENANQECQKSIAPICETGAIIDYLKACRNLRLETQKMQMLAETMVAALRKGNEGCFTRGNKNDLKGTSLRKLKKKEKKKNKKPSKISPHCHREMHWAKDCKSKFDTEEKLILENS